jgi:ABC-type taurine transport system substrate-binding protein
LGGNPANLTQMTDQQIYAMTPEIGEKYVKQLLSKKAEYAKNPDAVTVDSDQFKSIAKQYNITGKKELVDTEYKIKVLIDQEQQDRGRKLTFAEKDKLMREAFVKVPVDVEGKWFTQNVPLYDLANIKEKSKIAISGSDRKTIVDSLAKAGIEKPTEAQILRAYIELKKK